MATVDEDLNQLEKDIRQLKIEYDQYFGGGRARPPADTQWRIELLIKRYAERGAEINFGQRFRYNNLAQTYAKYREVFRKRFQQREEGTVTRHFGAAAKAIEAERAKEAPARANPAAVFSVACADPDHEGEKVSQLFEAFRKAKQSAGEDTERLTMEHFQEFLRKKTHQLREHKNCQEVEYVVAVEGKHVLLKARVKK